MTPEQKAKEIYKKYLKIIDPMTGVFVKHHSKSIAKQCSIEACDIAIGALEIFGYTTDYLQNMDGDFRWWENVKQEIEKI